MWPGGQGAFPDCLRLFRLAMELRIRLMRLDTSQQMRTEMRLRMAPG